MVLATGVTTLPLTDSADLPLGCRHDVLPGSPLKFANYTGESNLRRNVSSDAHPASRIVQAARPVLVLLRAAAKFCKLIRAMACEASGVKALRRGGDTVPV
jgi:hypothetical protein